jgi:hypothetical protein
MIPDIPDFIMEMLPPQFKTVVKMVLRKIKSTYNVDKGPAPGPLPGAANSLREKLRANIASKRARKAASSSSGSGSSSGVGAMHQLDQKHFEYRVIGGDVQDTTIRSP